MEVGVAIIVNVILMSKNYFSIPPYALKQVAKVLEKEHNLEPKEWSSLMNDLEASYQYFKSGKDINPDTGLYNLAHMASKALTLLEYYRTHPDLDDRYKPYLNFKRIVLDVDDVVADFSTAFHSRFNIPVAAYWNGSYEMKSRLDEIIQTKDFYVNLPVKHKPNFMPHAYVSSRSIPVEWTQEFLEKSGLPCCPVYHVPFEASKLEVLKRIDAEIFIDDKFDNFLEAQKGGITSYLMDAPHNQHYEVGYRRIKNLDIKNIIR